MKIVILTTVHSPYDVRIFHKECKTLAQAGYEVVLIAPHDRDEIKDGIQIRALPKPKNRIERMLLTVWRAYRLAMKENARVYHFHDPELLLVGILLCLQGKSVIYDIHEDVPKDIQHKFWIPPPMRKIIGKLVNMIEWFAANMLSGLITATPSIAQRFPISKTEVVQNFPIIELTCFDKIPYAERKNHIFYAGTIGKLYGPAEILSALSLLPEHLNVRWILAGVFGSAKLEYEVRQLPSWNRVDFHGWVDRSKVKSLMERSKIGVILYHPAPNHMECQPNKLFEYMMAGLPIIASDFPLWKTFVKDTGCGILINPLDPKAIADGIQWMIEHPEEAEAMGKRGREAVKNLYNWEAEGKKLLDFYSRL